MEESLQYYVDYSDAYKLEKAKLEKIKRKQIAYRNGVFWVVLLIPFALFLLRYVIVGGRILFFGNILYGPAILIYSFWLIWRAFINSQWKLAVQIAQRYDIDTLPKEREECTIRIGELKRKMDRYEKLRVEQERFYADDGKDTGGTVDTGEDLDWLLAGAKMPEAWSGLEACRPREEKEHLE